MLFGLGAAFMVASLAGMFGHLIIRALVHKQLEPAALGYFEAASTISITYIGFVLVAMGTDYYPRLTSVIRDAAAVNRLVNEQTEVALLLAGPIFLVIMGCAPLLIDLLYSDSFRPAVDVLRWQILGDIVKVASWPLSFIMLASGNGRTFMLLELFAVGVLLLLTYLGLPMYGVNATGMGYLGMYFAYLPLVYWLARRKTGFTWSTTARRLLSWLMLATLALFVIADHAPVVGVLVGGGMSAALAIFSFCRLAQEIDLKGPPGRLARYCRLWLIKIGLWRD